MGQGGVVCPKPARENRLRAERRVKRAEQKSTRGIHDYVFGRERDICRICRSRPAESMHELRFRSLGGKRSKRNSVAACGSGTTGCHGFAQANQIAYQFEDFAAGAEGTVIFTPNTKRAAEWMKLNVGQSIASGPTPIIRGDLSE